VKDEQSTPKSTMTILLLGTLERYQCSLVCHVGQRREEGTLEVAVDGAAVVEVVDGGEDAVKERTAGGELKGEVVLGLRLIGEI